MTTTRTRTAGRPAAALLALAAMLTVAGCGGPTLNGSTSCSTYLGLSGDDRATAVRAMLKDKGQPAGTGDVQLAAASAAAMCSLGAGQQISDIYSG